MVNCNPETVSTDYDTSDRLYFEPLTFEDVLEIWYAEDSSGRAAGGPGVVGVIVQLGGQTPLGLARRLEAAGVPIVGTSPDSIHLAEDRGSFGALLAESGLRAPAHGTATSFAEAKQIADDIGYPVLVRPSYVLGGRGMEIVYDDATLRAYIARATDISPEHPVLVDRFLDDAIEIDVDALCDAAGEVYLGGIMEHIEEAGIHSGDSACALPPITLASTDIAKIRGYTEAIARAVGVRGLLNVQYALKDDDAVRARGEPEGVADGAVRLEGDRRAAGEGGGADRARRHDWRVAGRGPVAGAGRWRGVARGCPDRREGGGAAVQALPHHRRARASTVCSARR